MKILSAKERAVSLEREIYRNLLAEVVKRASEIKELSRFVAETDLALALGDVAYNYGYVRPEIHTGYDLEITKGRHPRP